MTIQSYSSSSYPRPPSPKSSWDCPIYSSSHVVAIHLNPIFKMVLTPYECARDAERAIYLKPNAPYYEVGPDVERWIWAKRRHDEAVRDEAERQARMRLKWETKHLGDRGDENGATSWEPTQSLPSPNSFSSPCRIHLQHVALRLLTCFTVLIAHRASQPKRRAHLGGLPAGAPRHEARPEPHLARKIGTRRRTGASSTIFSHAQKRRSRVKTCSGHQPHLEVSLR
jgi:hypothetical protein